jgi:hypothetical protein
MTCRGYDIKAIKMPKAVKRRAARILNNTDRREYFKMYTKMIETNNRLAKSTKRGKEE